MYCLDTDIVVAFFRRNSEAADKLKQIKAVGADVAVTTLTLCELYRGAFLSSQRDYNLSIISELLETVTLLPQNEVSCLLFGQDYALLKKKGTLTQETDLMIASVCKANNRILVTRNIKDFKNIPELVVNSW